MQGYKTIHLTLNETEHAIVQARAELECRTMVALVRSATMFYAKYGPSILKTTQILEDQMERKNRVNTLKL